MHTALVTGATGMVGMYTVQRLLQDGWSVRAYVRDPFAASKVLDPRVELAKGDTLDAAAVSRAAIGCSHLIHAAAAVTPAGGWEAFRLPNIEGTKNVLRAASAAGARLVHVSSVAVYGMRYQTEGTRTAEDAPLAPLADDSFYARSKRESEALIMEAHRRGDVWATAVRPDVIYGQFDRQFIPRVARLVSRGFAPLIGGGTTTMAVVHASSVADGIVRAATSDVAGGRAYNLANDFDVTVAEFFRFAAVGLSRRIREVVIPRRVADVVLSAAQTIAPLVRSGALTALASSSIDFLSRDNPFTSERARRELGWTTTMEPRAGVVDAFRWWKQHHAQA